MKKAGPFVVFGPAASTFVQDDIRLLKRLSAVTVISTETFGKSVPESVLCVWRACLSAFTHRTLWIWFADFYSFLPALIFRLLGRRVIVIAGGFDVARFPGLGHGAWIRWDRRFAVKWTFRMATDIWPVSSYADQLLRQQMPDLKTSVLYLGVDPSGWPGADSDEFKQPHTVLGVGFASGKRGIAVKGLDRFIGLARENPDYQFIWIGTDPAAFKEQELPLNLQLIGSVQGAGLAGFYRTAAWYVQPSRVETFGKAAVEALLHGCTVIYSPETALKEVVGDVGYPVTETDWHRFHFADHALLPPALCRKRADLWTVDRRKESIHKRLEGQV